MPSAVTRRSPLRWVSRSQRQIVRALGERGFAVSQKLVGLLLRELGYSCQANRKTREGSEPSRPRRPVRPHQRHVVQAAMAAGQPAISVDTKKKELVGDFKNAGRELRPKGQPEPVRVHDFEHPRTGQGRALRRLRHRRQCTAGSASASMHDTAAFAVESIRRWWQQLGQARYPDAKRLLITADCGGSNGARVRLWKRELQRFADETRPGDHRLPSAARHQQVEPDRASPVRLHHPELARQAAGQPPGHRPADRRPRHRNRPHRALRDSTPTAIRRASRSPMTRWPRSTSTRDEFHGEWNYTISPNQQPP